MMLYVFHVDVGRMMSFDMTVALSSVENLKDTIERLHGIPASNIVLLVSGGEMLTLSTQVSCYSAGTDTNPIYMFLTGDGKVPPAIAPPEPNMDLREQIERCLELPAVYDTVVTRAQLALRLFDMAREEERVCERLVHEQHLQQQGWSAVVANMEDLTDEFRQRFRNFCGAFDRHLENRSKYLELLGNFGDDLTKLERIPILPGLMPLAEEDFHGFDEFLDTDEVFSRSTAQQESVLMVGDEAANGSDPTAPATPAPFRTSSGDGGGGGGRGGDDKSSTSPNKKLKMGSDLAEERITSSQTSTTSSSTRRRNLNLLQWITSRENHNTLKLMSDECVQGLGTFNEEVYDKLKSEVQKIIKLAEQGDVKEIKGLGERLCKLDEYKYKIKKMVQDQKELSTAFQQNQNRAINLRDTSILPDLCASHRSQLQVMQQNHNKIRDHRRCISKAKDELGTNLHTRLKRIVWLENSMSEFDNRLLFYHRCLRRAERHINIIEQIHQAPNIYVAAVTEVVRRKIFSGEFRTWASKLAEDFETIHSEEIQRRQLFNASFEGHFLNILFPGMNDMPPAFANENPLVFDARLPNITKSDIDMLTSNLPDLATEIQLPDMGPVINFFVSRSGEHQRDRLERLLKEQVAAVLNAGAMLAETALDDKQPPPPLPLPQHQRLNELQKAGLASAGGGGLCCDESETDTETEFEKLPSSVQNVATSTSAMEAVSRSTATERVLTHSAATLTEESESSARLEVERLRGSLSAMSKLAVDCMRMARVQLDDFRADATTTRADVQSELDVLKDKLDLMGVLCAERDQQLQQTTAEHQRELASLRETLQQRDAAFDAQAAELQTMCVKCATIDAEMEELRAQLEAAQLEKYNAVAAAREKLIHEHKTEIESLRCRFKLMTSMERSPSDTSLERIERPTSTTGDLNVIDLAQHEAMLTQMRAALEAEKERAVCANVGILKEMLEEKERQLDQMREKDLMLTKENFQLKTRVDALINEEANSWLQEKIEYMHRDKSRLQEELTQERTRRQEMESSYAALLSSTYEQGPQLRSKTIVLESCAIGDIVFVVWSVRHGQFMVVQDSQSLYFVHGDSLAALNLRLPTSRDSESSRAAVGAVAGAGAAFSDLQQPIPLPYYAIGRVIDKQYCQAKKDENRYRVTFGSKFYRIKLAPFTSKVTTRVERLESFSASISRSVSQCDSNSSESSMTATLRATNSSVARLQKSHSSSTGSSGGSGSGTSPSSSSSQVPKPASPRDAVDGGGSTTPPATASAGAITPRMGAGSASGSGSGSGSRTAVSLITSSGFVAMPTFKERTISITSVTEEEDEPGTLLGEPCRYISVSGEALPSMVVAAEAAPTTTSVILQQQQQQQSVITEQPTASSSNLQLNLLLAFPEIMSQQSVSAVSEEEQQQHQNPSSAQVPTVTTTTTTTAAAMPATAAAAATTTTTLETPAEAEAAVEGGAATSSVVVSVAAAIPIPKTDGADVTSSISPTIPTSIGTTSEDSDEYRSLEAKDEEIDFTITE